MNMNIIIANYSLTKPYEASQISEYVISKIHDILDKDTFDCVLTDGTAGSGSDTINFSKHFKMINSVEIDPGMFTLLSKNTRYIQNIHLYKDDYMRIFRTLNQDVVYLDPPWGGTDYKMKRDIKLELSGTPLVQIIDDILGPEGPRVPLFIKVPLNIDCSDMDIKETFYVHNNFGQKTFKILLFY
jgi:hypothetical protein